MHHGQQRIMRNGLQCNTCAPDEPPRIAGLTASWLSINELRRSYLELEFLSVLDENRYLLVRLVDELSESLVLFSLRVVRKGYVGD